MADEPDPGVFLWYVFRVEGEVGQVVVGEKAVFRGVEVARAFRNMAGESETSPINTGSPVCPDVTAYDQPRCFISLPAAAMAFTMVLMAITGAGAATIPLVAAVPSARERSAS